MEQVQGSASHKGVGRVVCDTRRQAGSGRRMKSHHGRQSPGPAALAGPWGEDVPPYLEIQFIHSKENALCGEDWGLHGESCCSPRCELFRRRLMVRHDLPGRGQQSAGQEGGSSGSESTSAPAACVTPGKLQNLSLFLRAHEGQEYEGDKPGTWYTPRKWSSCPLVLWCLSQSCLLIGASIGETLSYGACDVTV
jgi:hypothetical protein